MTSVQETHEPATSGSAVHRTNALVWQWQSFWAAVQFLTQIPVPAVLLADARDERPRLQLATLYFPLVGSLIGLVTGAVIWLASHLWPLWLAVGLGLVVEAIVTGALHEDALADCCDALGGGWTRADVLRILDDSRLGTYGVLGLTLALFLRAGALAALEPGSLLPVVVASATLGRWAMVLAMALLAPVPDRPSLTQQVGRQTFGHVLGGAVLAVAGSLPLAMASPLGLGLSVVAVLAVTAGFVFYLRRRIGGLTGDGAGAICYISQIAVLLCCTMQLGARV
ncbi:MAG TPA: adenosylcobinamide-GDP ribazoletransferase [Pirellulales bacterium]|nr:adenosylcobinamide-GDP ribazoletransferase [Pirellulales bacterium]